MSDVNTVSVIRILDFSDEAQASGASSAQGESSPDSASPPPSLSLFGRYKSYIADGYRSDCKFGDMLIGDDTASLQRKVLGSIGKVVVVTSGAALRMIGIASLLSWAGGLCSEFMGWVASASLTAVANNSENINKATSFLSNLLVELLSEENINAVKAKLINALSNDANEGGIGAEDSRMVQGQKGQEWLAQVIEASRPTILDGARKMVQSPEGQALLSQALEASKPVLLAALQETARSPGGQDAITQVLEASKPMLLAGVQRMAQSPESQDAIAQIVETSKPMLLASFQRMVQSPEGREAIAQIVETSKPVILKELQEAIQSPEGQTVIDQALGVIWNRACDKITKQFKPLAEAGVKLAGPVILSAAAVNLNYVPSFFEAAMPYVAVNAAELGAYYGPTVCESLWSRRDTAIAALTDARDCLSDVWGFLSNEENLMRGILSDENREFALS